MNFYDLANKKFKIADRTQQQENSGQFNEIKKKKIHAPNEIFFPIKIQKSYKMNQTEIWS